MERFPMSRKKKFSASVWREGRWHVAQCLEIDVASQGRSEAAALKNLADALALHVTPPVATRAPKIRPVEVTVRAA
jgi:predicted RNase H-like HicB family nuclease